MSKQEIKNHLVWAIVSVLMFWPTGIPAIIHALKVNGAVASADYSRAESESAKAKKWCKVSLIVWGTLVLFAICAGVIGACAVSKSVSSMGYSY